VRCCFIAREAVERIIEVSPETAQRFLERIATDLRRAEETYMQGACMPVRARLARLLFDMRIHYGTADDQGTIRIDLPLQRKDMASMLGTRPETLARTIRALGEDGVASFSGRKVEIEDLDTLLDEFDSDGVA
jgi:CRP/FNR family transcriptional regulator